MRFASIGSSNFASAGNNFGAQAQRSFGVTRSSSPNMGELANKGQQIKSAEKQAYNKIESEMRQQGIKEVGKHTVARLGREGEEIKRSGKRKAGALALLGKMAPVAVDAFGGGEKTKRRTVGETSSKYDPVISGLRDSADKLRSGMQNTDVNFKPLSVDTSSSNSNTGGTGTAGKVSGGSKGTGNLKMDYMTKLTGAGMSDEQAAAAVGHMMVETGGFKHMEELAPNVHGTKGYGHLQWTDPGSNGGRRTDFMNWSKSQGLDPQSFEANSGFLVHEMTTNFNKSWTGGGSFEGLKGQNTLEGASSYLQSNYIRPGIPHTTRRISEGRQALQEWQSFKNQ